MTELIACLTSGKGTWSDVFRLIDHEAWERVFIITNSFGRERFRPRERTELIVIDPRKPAVELSDDIKQSLEGKIKGLEVALNLTSGSGKEHMAILSALLKLGLGIRFVIPGPEGEIVEL